MPNADPNKNRRAWLQEKVLELEGKAVLAKSLNEYEKIHKKMGKYTRELEREYGLVYDGTSRPEGSPAFLPKNPPQTTEHFNVEDLMPGPAIVNDGCGPKAEE